MKSIGKGISSCGNCCKRVQHLLLSFDRPSAVFSSWLYLVHFKFKNFCRLGRVFLIRSVTAGEGFYVGMQAVFGYNTFEKMSVKRPETDVLSIFQARPISQVWFFEFPYCISKIKPSLISKMKLGFIFKATPHNPPSAPPGKFAPRFRHIFLQYTKYFCEKVPSSERKFSQDSLSPNDAVLP